MTRRDYEKFAAMFKQRRSLRESDGLILLELIMATADIFEADNDRFNRQLFYDACGGL